MQDRFWFRAICNDGKFHYGYLSRLYEDRGDGKEGDFCISNNSFCPYAYLVTRPETIGQCTGLEDKKGNLIFEGDIVELTRSRNYGWCRRGAKLKVQWNTFNCCGFGFGAIGNLTKKCAQNCIVIGNIHQNLELLEEISN